MTASSASDWLEDLPAYVINLDGSDERFASAQGQLLAAGIAFERVAAYDGRGLRLDQFPDYDARRALAYMGRPLRGGEIGCYLSHLEAARRFLASGKPFALVFEDDLRLFPEAPQILQQLLRWARSRPVDWDMINLAPSKHKVFTSILPLHAAGKEFQLTRAHYFPMSATGILWSRDGARAFVEEHRSIFAPLDNYFRHWMTGNDRGLAMWPAIMGTIDAVSDIAPLCVTNRSAEGRVFFYGLIKQRRLFTYKTLAWLHRLRRALTK